MTRLAWYRCPKCAGVLAPAMLLANDAGQVNLAQYKCADWKNCGWRKQEIPQLGDVIDLHYSVVSRKARS